MKSKRVCLIAAGGLLAAVVGSVGCSSETSPAASAPPAEADAQSAVDAVTMEPGSDGAAVGASAAREVPSVDLEKFEAVSRRQIEAAERAVREAAAEDQGAAWAKLAALYHSFELFDVAIDCYRNAERALPRQHRWPYLRGRAHEAEGDVTAARAAYLAARSSPTISEAPVDVQAAISNRLAGLALSEGNFAAAEKRLRETLRFNADDAWAGFSRGRIALQQGRTQEAIGWLEPVHRQHPEATNVAYLLGSAYRRAGREKAGAALMQQGAAGGSKLVASDPLMNAVRQLAQGSRRDIDQGNRLFLAGRFNAAKEAFERALQIDPQNARTHTNLGSVFEKLGDDQSARNCYEAALAEQPDFAAALFNLGVLEARDGDDRGAVQHYSAVLAQQPTHRDALFNRGNAHMRLGQFENAAKDFAAVIQHDSGNVTARLARARCLVLMQDFAAAARGLRAAIQIAPDDLTLQHDLSRLLVAAPDDRVRDGVKGLRLAQSVFAEQSWVAHAETVAMGLAETGRFEEAVRIQQSAIAAAVSEGRSDLADSMQDNLSKFQAGQPARTPWLRHSLLPTTEILRQ